MTPDTDNTKAHEHRCCLEEIPGGAVPTEEALYLRQISLILCDLLEELEKLDGSSTETESRGKVVRFLRRLSPSIP